MSEEINWPLRINTYGAAGPGVILLHGGPGAPGRMAPVARELADAFQVVEPWQRHSSNEPLTVACHVEDLHELASSHCPGGKPVIIGESWGAMLALAYAAEYPGTPGALILIGCGTFDPAARARMREIIDQRTDDNLRHRLEDLQKKIVDPEKRMAAIFELIRPLYTYDADSTIEEEEHFDARGHRQTWDDMVRLQTEGIYPAAFTAIKAPVLMLHGAYDPHPGQMIRQSLIPYLPQLEYQEWEHCGHSPWLEKAVRKEFFSFLRQWLSSHFEK